MKKHLLPALLAVTLLFEAGGVVKPARAEVLRTIHQEISDLEQALCQQEWQKALQTSDLLINSPGVSHSYKNTLRALQPLLEEYQREGLYFENSPWCGGAAGVTNAESTIDSILTLRPYWSGLVRNGGASGDSSGGGLGSSGGAASGNCDTPDDIAADGSRCGGRAASERPGGR